MPFFLGYFEDSDYAGPHYQSVVPLQQGPILTSLKENGGCDVEEMLGFEKTGHFCSEQLQFSLEEDS